jgi:hypothetical protein
MIGKVGSVKERGLRRRTAENDGLCEMSSSGPKTITALLIYTQAMVRRKRCLEGDARSSVYEVV